MSKHFCQYWRTQFSNFETWFKYEKFLDDAFEKHFERLTEGQTSEQKAKARKQADDFADGLMEVFDEMFPDTTEEK